MINYFEYAKPLYKKAKNLMYARYFFLLITLISLVFSVITTGKELYISTLTALFASIIAWFINKRSKIKKTLANDFHKQGLLANSYEIIENSFKISHLIARVDKQTNKIGSEANSNEINKTPLSHIIHENSYWNHHQYNELFKIYIAIILVVIFTFCAVALYSIPFINLNSDYLIPRLAFTVLSFSILYEMIENTIKLYNSSQQMLDMDNEISRTNKISEYKIIDLYNSYISVIESTPDIPEFLYERNKEQLNKGWAIRLSETYGVD